MWKYRSAFVLAVNGSVGSLRCARKTAVRKWIKKSDYECNGSNSVNLSFTLVCMTYTQGSDITT